ncbi:MAG TPA: 2-oxoglutarate dehydrogenase complex dihydrolipoyllysine-residue succinyltransferase [Candidatus Kryptonia bacterium]
MKSTITVPTLGESVVEARITRWLKKEGDSVEIGDGLVELETEKVNVDVSAQSAGILSRILVGEEQTVHIGDVIGEMESSPTAVVDTTAEKTKSEVLPQEKETDTASRPIEEGREPELQRQQHDKATPVARKVADLTGLNVSEVSGSGTGGRVTKHDVESFIRSRDRSPEPGNGKSAGNQPIFHGRDSQRREERMKMSLRRKTIARRMVEAQQSAAMLTTFNEIDMSRVMELRKKYKERFNEKYGINLGITSFFVEAAVGALKEFPRLNAEIDGDDIIYKYYYDIGVAIGAEEGLVVPVIRDAESLSFAEIELSIRNFADKSKNGTLTLDDLRGGTFTITNGGVFGSLMSTPILNPPQVGILGLHKVADRAVVEEGQVVVKPMMYVALTYDHRIVDGRESVQFLTKVKEFIEDPAAMVLG